MGGGLGVHLSGFRGFFADFSLSHSFACPCSRPWRDRECLWGRERQWSSFAQWKLHSESEKVKSKIRYITGNPMFENRKLNLRRKK
jgi:hypothetical protein